MSALWSYDQHDSDQTEAELDYADWQESERHAQEIGRRYNWNIDKIEKFAMLSYRIIRTQRGAVNGNTNDIPY